VLQDEESTAACSDTYSTRGLKPLLENVCSRLSCQVLAGNLILFRLDTQFGDGKPHSLIALVHAVCGMQGMGNAQMFIDSALLPKGNVCVAVLDGKKSDPSNGLKLAEGLCTHSL
jgi:hypothetical protein